MRRGRMKVIFPVVSLLATSGCGFDVVEFTVTEKSALAGVLVDATGAAREDIPLELRCGNQTVAKITNQLGQYDFGVLEPGTCKIWVGRAMRDVWKIKKVNCRNGKCQIDTLGLKVAMQT